MTIKRTDIAVGDVFYPRNAAVAKHSHKRVLALLDQHHTRADKRKVLCSIGTEHNIICSEATLLRWGKRRDGARHTAHLGDKP